MKRVGFMGPKGSFSQEAVKLYLRNLIGYKGVSYYNISDMIKLVENGNLDEAILPVENSIEGAVNLTLDLLSKSNNIYIKSELVIDVNVNLLVVPGARMDDIEVIMSHPQPIGQCRNFLNKFLPRVQIKQVYTSAMAAEEVSKLNDKKCAVLGSVTAAEEYSLEILKSNIRDEDNNNTRFVVISKDKVGNTGRDKTSIIFSTEDRPGSLYRILDIFNLWDINMTKIVSRPKRNELGKYIFFVDILGHIDDSDVNDAITMIKRKTSYFKFLGSYPIYINDKI
ncbi:MAG: prephenate dehydratase [Clostridiales bacterium]